MRLALVLSLAVIAAATIGCKPKPAPPPDELADIGVGNATTEPAPGMHNPLARGDLAAIAETGRWVHAARLALELADEAVLKRMGAIASDLVLPLVDIDPGGMSGQVVFVRWPGGVGSKEPLRVEDAQRWVLVALMLQPERVVDVELLTGNPVPGSTEARRIEALLIGTAELQRQAAGKAFYTADRFVVEPVVEKKRRSRVLTVIYALERQGDGPDLELAVDEPVKRGKKQLPPPLVRAELIHRPGALLDDPVLVPWADPHPLTVARALERDPQAAPLAVRARSGLYSVASRDGTVERVGP